MPQIYWQTARLPLDIQVLHLSCFLVAGLSADSRTVQPFLVEGSRTWQGSHLLYPIGVGY